MHPTLLDGVCWGAFLVVWFGAAVYNGARGPRTAKRSWSWYGQAAIGLVAAVVVVRYVPRGFWSRLSVHSMAVALLGSAFLLVSTGFILWARYVLGRMWSSAPMIKQGHALRTTGPYAITRHPIYTGLLGMAIGTTLEHGLGFFVPWLAMVVLVLVVKLRVEEKLLVNEFGEEYLAYKRRVPQLIPGLTVPSTRS